VSHYAAALADHAVTSLASLAIMILLVRSLEPADFGAYALIVATYTLAQGIARALVAEPLLVRHSAAPPARWRVETSAAAGAALMVAAFGALICCGAGLLLGNVLGKALIVLALGLPFLISQDLFRYSFYAAGRARTALVNNAGCLGAYVLGVALLLQLDRASVAAVTLIWGLCAAVAVIAAAFQARVRPRLRTAPSWLRENVRLGYRYALEFLSSNGSAQVSQYVIGLVAGLPAAGVLRFATALMGPITVIISGVSWASVPRAVRMRGGMAGGMLTFGVLISAALGAGSVIWAALLLGVPDRIGHALVGARGWESAESVMIPVGVMIAGAAVATGALVGLRGLAAARRSLRAQLVAGPTIVIGAWIGVTTYGLVGGAVGMATGYAVGALTTWLQFRRALSEAA
jgi:O-antigen/teichoic acid export membrane protein